MHGSRYRAPVVKIVFLVPLFACALFYISSRNQNVAMHDTDIGIVEDRVRNNTVISNVNSHITCDYYKINEDIKATNNPEYYLEYNLDGERHAGGSLVRDLRFSQEDSAITICGHNLDEKNKKFSNLGNAWEKDVEDGCPAYYYNGRETMSYQLWGAYRIDATDIDVAYPIIKDKRQLQSYLTGLTRYEGWNTGDSPSSMKRIMILLTCSEPIKEAPHRTIVIFAA